MIGTLKEEDYLALEPLIVAHFGSMPNPKRSRMIGCFDDNGGGLRGFLIYENLGYVGMPYVKEGEDGATIIRQLIDHVEEKCKEEKVAVVSIASEPRFEKLLEHKGMHEVEGKLYRRNFDEE